jgi:predicted nucleic acid-binding Zn ribbon protein
MARTDAYRDVERWCVMCQKPIPADRKWDAVTCGKECSKKRKDYGRSRKDQTTCRYCNKPSTPEDRVLFGAWRKAQRKGMTDEEFIAQVLEVTRLVHDNERLKRKLAELEVEGD